MMLRCFRPSARLWLGALPSGPRAPLTALLARATLGLLCIPLASAAAPSLCNAGDQTLLQAVSISQSCFVTGNLNIGSGGRLVVDFSGDNSQVFAVAGNITMTGNASLQVQGGTFAIQQDYNRHRLVQTFGSATIVLRDTRVSVNQGPGLKYMVYNAFDDSQMFAVNSRLDNTTDWLLANFFGHSKLTAIDAVKVPTEIYVKEASTVKVSGTTNSGIWLDLVPGMSGTINLPLQADAGGNLQPFSWSVGRESPTLANVPWQLTVAGASPGLGVESHEGSLVTINGQGWPSNGELRISYDVESGTKTLGNLGVGLQNINMESGRLVLNNVQLGLVAWQVYAIGNQMLTISNSVLNEVGASANGHVQVNDSILQFAGATALGTNSTVDIARSQIYSQTIEAMQNGVVTIRDSAIYGAALVTTEPTSRINVYDGAFLQNASGSCPFSSASMTPAGVPLCNPFLAPGASVTKAGLGVFTCTRTINCNW